jgi:hypothetical protein
VEEEEEEEEESKSAKRAKTRGANMSKAKNCNINFVKDTSYYLRAGSSQRLWGTATADDPAPPVPVSRKDSCKPGDYLLVKGKNIKVRSNGANYTTTTFHPEEELILTSDWHQFEQDMTGQDLADLDDETFLLWWQNFKPPPVPKVRPPTVAKKTQAAAPTKKSKRLR